MAYYSVQVKSNNRPIVFSSRESVEWLINYPSALLLCVVDKRAALIRVFQTTARFSAAITVELPDRLKLLLSTQAGIGKTIGWEEGDTRNCKLGPPILEFKTDDLLSDGLVLRYLDVLTYWVQCDSANVRRYQMGLRSIKFPRQYETNKVPTPANAGYFLNYANTEILVKAEETALEIEEWLGPLKLKNDDHLGALLAALRLRHSDPDYSKRRGSTLAMDLRAATAIEASTGTQSSDYVFAPLDKLLKELLQKLGD